MTGLLQYLFEASISLVVLYFPFFIFRNNTFFGMNRFYLLVAMLLSAIIPLLNISFSPVGTNGISQVLLEPVSVFPKNYGEQVGLNITLLHVLFYIYISGTFIYFILFAIRIYQIIGLVRRHQVTHEFRFKTVTVGNDVAPSSFFNYIFLPENENVKEIIAHEKVHIRQKHSWDIIFVELFSILFWFNPARIWYKKELRNIHEYQADREILLKGVDAASYQQLLVEKAFGFSINALAISFNYSPLKKRLIMMTRNNSKKRSIWQYALIFPLLAATFIYFGCETNPSSTQPGAENLEEIEAFDVVDVMPVYPGGISALRQYVAQNLRYPRQAHEKSISGKVYVKFVVNAKGEVISPRIVRSDVSTTEMIKVNNAGEIVVIAYAGAKEDGTEKEQNLALLEEEALRVVSSIPDFSSPGYKGGKRASVFFTLPVVFVLQ